MTAAIQADEQQGSRPGPRGDLKLLAQVRRRVADSSLQRAGDGDIQAGGN
jgi:hypothetical protein